MKIKESNRKYIFTVVVFFILASFFIANIMGKTQDKSFSVSKKMFDEMVTQLQQGHYESALEKVSDLEDGNSDSEVVNYIIGLATANASQSDRAASYFQKTLDINPYKVEDPMFMLQYAEVLVQAKMLEEASIVLERCTMFVAPESFPQYHDRIIELQEQINGKS